MPKNYVNSVNTNLITSFYYQHLPKLLHNVFSEKILSKISKRIISRDHLFLPYLELCITPKCTLRCRYCANFMPFYKKADHYSLDNILTAFDKLLQSIDGIFWFRILGGEPFLHPSIGEIVNHCSKKSKINQIDIVTNGTIIPNDTIIKILSKSKCRVEISNYETISSKRNDLIKILQKNNIKVIFENNKYDWEDMGTGQRIDYTKKQVEINFMACQSICKTLVKNELHICPRSAHGTALGFIQKREEDYIDVLGYNTKDLRKKIKELFDTKFIEACYHCIGPYRKTIKAAEQI